MRKPTFFNYSGSTVSSPSSDPQSTNESLSWLLSQAACDYTGPSGLSDSYEPAMIDPIVVALKTPKTDGPTDGCELLNWPGAVAAMLDPEDDEPVSAGTIMKALYGPKGDGPLYAYEHLNWIAAFDAIMRMSRIEHVNTDESSNTTGPSTTPGPSTTSGPSNESEPSDTIDPSTMTELLDFLTPWPMPKKPSRSGPSTMYKRSSSLGFASTSESTGTPLRRRELIRILNPRRKNLRQFHLFPLLPTELRLRIWELVMTRERILHVQLGGPDPKMGWKLDGLGKQGDWWVDRDGKLRPLRMKLKGVDIVPKLLHVNQESRAAALRFYRVHIPCWYAMQSADAYTEEGTLYSNPEWDIFSFDVMDGDRKRSLQTMRLFQLYTELRAHDPLGVGIENLVLDTWGVEMLQCCVPDAPEWVEQKDVRQLLRGLKQVFFRHTSNTAPRDMAEEGKISPDMRWLLHQSRPIMSYVPRFERVLDPRPIGEQLKHVYLEDSDLREMVEGYGEILKAYNVRKKPGAVQYRLMISRGGAYDFWVPDISDRMSALRWVSADGKRWLRQEVLDSCPSSRLHPTNLLAEEYPHPEVNLPHTVRPAIGFWLFPVNLLTDIPRESEGAQQVFDFSDCTPEIGLQELY